MTPPSWSRPPSPDVLVLPLQSDAPWIHAGVAGVTVACMAAFIPLFRGHHHPALGLIPALTAAVFAGSGLAAWGRTRGGTTTLEVTPGRVEVRDPSHRQEVLHRGEPWSAVLLVDREPGRRMLVLGQRSETIVVLEPSPVPAPGNPPASPPGPAWQGRTVTSDLGALALSPASAGVVTLAAGTSLTGLLMGLESDLEAETPWMQHQMPGGESLRVYRTELWLGNRRVTIGSDTRVAAYGLHASTGGKEGKGGKGGQGGQGGAVAALGIAQGEDAETMVLLACEEAGVASGAVVSDLTPDAYVPLHVFEALRAVAGASRG